MMLRRYLLALAVLMVSVPLLGQQHPNVERGFQADKVYQFGGIDNVNLYNGNLSLTIPIGGEYSGSGALKYRFALVYNSKAWDEELHFYENPLECDGSGGAPPVECFKWYVKTIPSKASNAGMGWLLSFGRLVAGYTDSGGQPIFIYEGPDGAQHTFWKEDAAAGSAVRHTTDGSFLRISYQSASQNYEVHFPDGMIQSFDLPPNSSAYRLEQIRDLFGNHLDIEYGSGAGGTWTLKEYDAAGLVRQHYVHFRDMSLENPPPANVPPNYQFAVREIDLAAFGDTIASDTRATYTLQHTVNEILYDCFGDSRPHETPKPIVPQLRHIVLPDGSQWDADYFYGGCSGISQLVLPTKGRMEWTYSDYGLDTSVCPDPLDPGELGKIYLSIVKGVATKTVVNNGQSFMWTYTQGRDEHVIWSCSQSGATSKPRQSTVTVLSPDGRKTEHYFSIWNEAPLGDNVFDRSEYGLPFTRGTGSGCAAAFSSIEFCLSSREYDCSTGQCSSSPARSHYVRYEGDSRYSALGTEGYGYRREVARRTIFHDDLNRSVDVVRSRYDGLGHFRKVVTSDSWSGLSRAETTEYNHPQPDVTVNATTWENNPANNRPGWPAPWLLNLFTTTEVSENGTTEKGEICFDSTNGRLKRKRMLAGTTRQSKDLLAVFDHTAGNLTRERYFGGDATPLSGFDTDTCNTPVSDTTLGAYTLTHEYASGARKTTQYAGVSFKSLELTIDGNTGLPRTSKDTSLLLTENGYDSQGRLTSEKPPGQAWTEYKYITTAIPPTVEIRQWPNGAAAAGTPLTERRFYFDGFGRVIQTKNQMTGGWSTVRTVYDASGRITSTSMPEYRSTGDFEVSFVPAHLTSMTYDIFGRTKSVTAPDASTITFGYTGERLKTRTAGIWTGGPLDSAVIGTEEYDGFGRLRNVTEKSGPTSSTSVMGSDVLTTYTYDSGNRLTSVKMGASTGPVQNRLFDYDGRGFLRWESQPESGITSYEYDARGHVVSKTQSAANSLFDLKFTYDQAERPTLIEGRNPLYDPANPTPYQPPFRPLKEFTYENNANNGSDRRLGKLTRATRHNYGELLSEAEFEVSDAYEYTDAAGRKTKRTTSITEIVGGVGGSRYPVRDITTSTEYNDLDLPAKMKYPTCLNCGLPSPDPERYATTWIYEFGRLKSLSGYVSNISYWPNGMRNVLQHTNAIADTQDVNNMPRPSQLSFGVYDRCVRPTFLTQPLGGQVAAAGQSFPLSVTMNVNGTGPFTYEWRNLANWALVGTTASITVNPTATTEYFVDVTGPCGHERSQKAKVTIGQCAAPSTGVIEAVRQPDGSWILKPDTEARAGRTFNWTRPPDTNSLGTSETLAVGVLSVTTTYHLTVTDTCGTGGGDVTITVPLPITSGLQATAAPSMNPVSVTWPAIAGATQYTVRRRSGSAWETVGTTAAPSFNDTTVAASRTYAYHVTSNNGGSTDYDVATTMSFTAAISGQPITAPPVNDMLNAANKVRAAAGWPALTWSNILAASDPLPAPGSGIPARHIMSCRARMNEALQALGVRILPYANADLAGDLIHAADINEVQQRAQ